MKQQAITTLSLDRLMLSHGEGRRLQIPVRLGRVGLGSQEYRAEPETVPVEMQVSRTATGHAFRLSFGVRLEGPCMRCLRDAAVELDVDAREVDQPGGGDELSSPYVRGEELDLQAWARDALVLALPAQLLCRPDCAGLCPECGKDLNVEPHEHEKPPDPRWDALRGLDLSEKGT